MEFDEKSKKTSKKKIVKYQKKYKLILLTKLRINFDRIRSKQFFSDPSSEKRIHTMSKWTKISRNFLENIAMCQMAKKPLAKKGVDKTTLPKPIFISLGYVMQGNYLGPIISRNLTIINNLLLKGTFIWGCLKISLFKVSIDTYFSTGRKKKRVFLRGAIYARFFWRCAFGIFLQRFLPPFSWPFWRFAHEGVTYFFEDQPLPKSFTRQFCVSKKSSIFFCDLSTFIFFDFLSNSTT